MSDLAVMPVGDAAVAVVCGRDRSEAVLHRVRRVLQQVRGWTDMGVLEWVPGYLVVLGTIDPTVSIASETAKRLSARLADEPLLFDQPGEERARHVEIPVVYGGEYGPDLPWLAEYLRCSEDELIRTHVSADYHVALMGFVPGFPYLSGLPKALAAPRRDTPRAVVPAGSVGIAGEQTGIYPTATPGGWQLIGRTPIRLFDLSRPEPFLLRPGDHVRFLPITPDDYEARLAASNIDSPCAQDNAVAVSGNMRGGIEIVQSGLHTTIQDQGRIGHTGQGIARAGAMDWFAAAVANLLVGNSVDAALLECTLIGPILQFHQDALVCVTGADLAPRLDDSPFPMWRAVRVCQGSRLSLTGYYAGCRAYVAVAGGLDVPPVMGSRSTDVRQAFGGFEGRALRTG
ncbi:MAG: 5-oxoprolinase subunit PxpB, partial [Alicyclobacillus sp.]|nr:5-oxoprolinase subunit PxpB [Alicyclobacillus sp.]